MKKDYFRETFPIIAIFSIILVVFYPAIFNQFKADDFAWVYGAKISKDDIRHAFTPLDIFGGFFRPFNHLLFLGWYYLFGLNHVGYHAVNILLFHFVNSVLVYFVAKKLVNRKVAFVSALIFAVMVAHFDSTLFQSGGMADNSLSTFFTLVSFTSFIKWHESNKKNYLVVSLIVFIFNLLSYESSVILPALIFAYLMLFSKKIDIGGLLETIKKLIPYAVPLFPYLIFQYLIQKSGPVVNLGIYYLGWHFLKNIFDYFVSILIAFPMIDIADLSRIGISEIANVIIQPIVIVTYATVLLSTVFILFKGTRNSKFFFLWFVIGILPFSFFTNPEQSRYTYGASIGISVLLAMLLYYVYEKSSYYIGIGKSKFMLFSLVSLIIVANSISMILVENYKFNNGVSDELVMISFMKSKYSTFPDGSKIYFVNNSLPLHGVLSGMIINLYYPEGVMGPHIIETYENGVINTYTIYYHVNYTIYEIARDEVPSIPRDNLTYIFDFRKSDYRPGKGIDLT